MVIKRQSIVNNAIISFAGQVLTSLAALVCMPVFTHVLGKDRVGLFSLIWVILGYFSVLDLGLGRAVTKSVSEALALGDDERVPRIFWSALVVQIGIGILGGICLLVATPWLVHHLLHVPAPLTQEARWSLYFAAIGFPLVLISSSVVGLIQAAQRIDLSTAVQSPMSVAQFLLPLICVHWWPSLPVMIGIMLAVRAASMFLLCGIGWRLFPHIARDRRFMAQECRRLLGFGGWVTVSNLISPLLVYLDRLMISALLTLSFVAYYSVPADAVYRMLIIPSSLMTALFPIFSSMEKMPDRERQQQLINRTVKLILMTLGIPITLMILFAPDIMQLWMGAEFAQHSTLVLRIMLVGIFACAFSTGGARNR